MNFPRRGSLPGCSMFHASWPCHPSKLEDGMPRWHGIVVGGAAWVVPISRPWVPPPLQGTEKRACIAAATHVLFFAVFLYFVGMVEKYRTEQPHDIVTYSNYSIISLCVLNILDIIVKEI